MWEYVGDQNYNGSYGNYWTNIIRAESSAATVDPPARDGAVTWIDNGGNLLLFGGEGRPGFLNDIWSFNPGSKTWS